MKKRIYTLLTGILLASAYLVFALAVPQTSNTSMSMTVKMLSSFFHKARDQ